MNLFYYFTKYSFLIIFKILYRLEVKGIENIPKGKAIIASNHVSYFDPPIIAAACRGELSFLAMEPLFKNSIFGFLIRHLNAYPISGNAGDLKSIKTICRLLNEKRKVVIFPEGERTTDGIIKEVKPGFAFIAQKTDSPIVPVYIKGAFDVWPITRRFPKLFGKITCTFGPPIHPQDFKHVGKKEAINALSDKVLTSIQGLNKD